MRASSPSLSECSTCEHYPGLRQWNNSIDIDGVLLALAGSGLSEVSASISVSGDFRLERSQVTVINTVVDELDDEDVTTVFEVGDKDVDHKLTLLRHTGEVAGGKADKVRTQDHREHRGFLR